MKYGITTYNGHAINDGTNYRATFLAGVPLLPDTDPILIERSENWPIFAGKNLPGHEITLEIRMEGSLGNLGTRRDELKSWLPTDDQTLRKLIIQDADNSNKQWYLYVTPTGFVPDGRRVIVTLSVPDPYWRSETLNSVTWTVTATGQTQAVTPGGNANARPILAITPNNAKTGGYAYKRLVTLRNLASVALVNYPIELTGGWNTSTEVGAGRMQADGDDLRVEVDGVEVDRWISGINTATTKVWANLSLSLAISLTLSGNMGTGAITTIAFKKTKANKNALKKLPATFTILIGSEYFLCSAPIASKYSATVVSRAALGSTAASHTDGDAIYWNEHIIWIYYGNSSVAAPDVDDSRKPILDLTNSTNTSWVYTEFADDDFRRTGIWTPSMVDMTSDQTVADTGTPTSNIYTATQNAYADPASVAGIRIAAYQKSGAWKPETGSGEWRLYQPCGVTTVASASGSLYRYAVDWPSVILQRTNGSSWGAVYTTTKPASVQTWTAWSVGSTALGATYHYLRWYQNGTVRGSANNLAAGEMTAITLTLDNTATPSVTFGSQQNNYYLDCIITNNTTGKAITVKYLMGTAQTVTVDCELLTVTHSSGANCRPAFDTDTRRLAWLDLQPGANTLQFDDTGTNNLTVVVSWRDRNS